MTIGNLSGPFDVQVEDLARLDAREALDVLHGLLIAEAIQASIPVTAISVPRALTTSDGGIDAEVAIASVGTSNTDLLGSGPTSYQVKTGHFSATSPAEIRSLVLRPLDAKRRRLKPEHIQPRVKECLDQNGTFAIALFGSDAVGKRSDYGAAEIVTLLAKADVRYSKAKVRIIRANQLCAAIKVLTPALALQINRLPLGPALYRLDALRSSFDLQIGRHQSTPALLDLEKAITTAADSLSGFQHIRIVGDAGAGKTHLVFRALSASSVADLTLYCPEAEALQGSIGLAALVGIAPTATFVLVADECDAQLATLLTVRLRNVARRCLLITIYNQYSNDDSLGGSATVIDVPPLAESAMAAIFAGYGVPGERIDWLVKLLEGSPRAAHRIGQVIAADPQADYVSHFPKLTDLWERTVTRPDDVASAEGMIKLTIVRCIALFRRLPWDGSNGRYGRDQLHSLLATVDPSISLARMVSTVAELRKKKVLQGASTIYITPRLLHVQLWVDWWERFGHIVTHLWLSQTIQPEMLEGFYEMLQYAKESSVASAFIDALTSEAGPMSDLARLAQPENAKLFFAVAQANPKRALRLLTHILGTASVEERTDFKIGRREVVDRLAQMAVPATDFFAAAECLLLLAEAENETWSNNATGIFLSLFSLGYGRVAPSELSPIAKIPYLRNILKSESPARRQLAIRALEESLRPFISRVDLGDEIGLRRLPDRWMPKSNDELEKAYAAHVQLIGEAFVYASDNDKPQIAKAVISNARSLVQFPLLAAAVINLMRDFATDRRLRPSVVEAVESTLHYDEGTLGDGLRAGLQSLRDEIVERSFHDRLFRFAGLQLIEDHFGADGEYREGPRAELIELASEALDQPARLRTELGWLNTGAAKNAFQFGFLLGSAPNALDLWTDLKAGWLNVVEPRSDFFLGGYFAGLFHQDPGLWELVIGEIFFSEAEWTSHLVPLVWRSGMTNPVARELLRRCEAGQIQTRQLQLLVYGAVVKLIPADVFRATIELLLSSKERADADAALDLLEGRRRTSGSEDENMAGLTFAVLSHPAFVKGDTHDKRGDTMRDYHWGEAAKTLVDVDPAAGRLLAELCIGTFGSKGAVTDTYSGSALEFLDLVLSQWPATTWNAITKNIGPKIDLKAFRLLQWLRGNRGSGVDGKSSGLELMPPEIVLEWIRRSPGKRAWLIAEYCPPVISTPNEPKTLARLILEHYGEMENVRASLHANFSSGAFWGPASSHFRERLNQISLRKAEESNELVRLWFAEEQQRLEAMVKAELEREEANDW